MRRGSATRAKTDIFQPLGITTRRVVAKEPVRMLAGTDRTVLPAAAAARAAGARSGTGCAPAELEAADAAASSPTTGIVSLRARERGRDERIDIRASGGSACRPDGRYAEFVRSAPALAR
ncbi:hypothetical protein GCM10027265_31350 [Jatrophihabitans fulvus]